MRYKNGDESPNLQTAFKLFEQHWPLLVSVKGFRNHTLKLARRVARKLDRVPGFFRSGGDLKGFLIMQVTLARKEFEREDVRQGSNGSSVRTQGYGYGGDHSNSCDKKPKDEVNTRCYHEFPVELSNSVSSYAKELVASRSPVTVDSVRERFKVKYPVAVQIIAQVRMELEDELLGAGEDHD